MSAATADASIRIKLGQIEVEYQGDSSFLKKELLDTVKKLLELQQKHAVVAPPQHDKRDRGGSGGHGVGGNFAQSTDTIANLISAKSGPDLVIAAAAHLHFVKAKQTFTRQEIIDEMRTAPGHFKDTYVNNMSSYLNTLKTKDRLRLVSNDNYSLSNREKKVIEAKLAQDS